MLAGTIACDSHLSTLCVLLMHAPAPCGPCRGDSWSLAWRRDEERRWRAEDLEQRALDNARVLWARFVEKNRRDVEERAEQLKGFSNLAALVAGFVMISYLQVTSRKACRAVNAQAVLGYMALHMSAFAIASCCPYTGCAWSARRRTSRNVKSSRSGSGAVWI